MKILMLGWELPPHINGGMGIVCFEMSKVLAQYGASIDFVLPYTAEHPDAHFMNIISTSSATPHPDGGFGVYNDWINSPTEFKQYQDSYIQTAVSHAIKNKPDVIHAHDWLTLNAAVAVKKAVKRPLIAHVHATEFDRSGGEFGNPVIHDIEQHGLLAADRIIAVSAYTKKLIVSRYDIPEEKIEVIHNTINYHDFKSIAENDVYRYITRMKQEGYYVIGSVGRLTIQKGYAHLIRAAGKASKRLSRFIFIIGGSGELRDELLELSAEQGIADKVILTGFVSGSAWRGIYNLSDAFVMSSVSEPFGITPLEAAVHNNAIVITKQTGANEVLNNSLKYDYWDEDRLADIFLNLATSKALTMHLKTEAAKEISHMNWAATVPRFIEQYQRLGATT